MRDIIYNVIMLKLPTVFFLIAFSFLAVVHVVALQLFLYWHYWWFDLPMHFIGGAVVALGLFTLYDLRLVIPERYLALIPVLLLVLLIAMVWEVYELFIGVPIEGDYVSDTLIDLVMGLSGGALGYFVGTNLRKI